MLTLIFVEIREARCDVVVVKIVLNVVIDLTGCWKSHPYRRRRLLQPPTTPFLFKGFATTAVEIAIDGTHALCGLQVARSRWGGGGGRYRERR